MLLAPAERAGEFTGKPVRVLGIAQASDFVALDQKPDITTFPALRRASGKAYRMAGVGPADIQLAELHDCFTIAEIIAIPLTGWLTRVLTLRWLFVAAVTLFGPAVIRRNLPLG